MLAGCLEVSLLLGPTLTERETSQEIIVRHKSLFIDGASRGLEELIVLLNQRNKFLAGYHSYLPSAYEERWQLSGSATAIGKAKINIAGDDGCAVFAPQNWRES